MFVSPYWSHVCGKSQVGGKLWFSVRKISFFFGLHKYLSRIYVGVMSDLFCSVLRHMLIRCRFHFKTQSATSNRLLLMNGIQNTAD